MVYPHFRRQTGRIRGGSKRRLRPGSEEAPEVVWDEEGAQGVGPDWRTGQGRKGRGIEMVVELSGELRSMK